MATNAKVGIDIEVLGYEGAKSKMSDLEGMMKGLNGHKAKVKLEADLKNFEKDLKAKKAHKIKVQADMKSVQGEIRKTNQMMKKLQNYKLRLKAEGKDFSHVDKMMLKLRERLTSLNGQRINIQGNLDSLNTQIQAATANIDRLKAAIRSVETMSLGQIFNGVSSRVAHIGQAMQSMGNALTRMGAPMRNMFRYMGLGAGFAAFNKVSEGLMSGFQRYDTMQNYARSLESLGLDASKKFVVGTGKAQTAIENLNDAVLGLPTGLDEIVAAQKVYAGATGEMVKSTKTAIAANNTFLASATEAREQRFMQRYLASLASGAELASNQWDSMARIAPLAMRAVSEELGYASDKYQDFIKDVKSGTIAGEEFLDAFIKVGTEGKVANAANVMKTTFEGLSANVQNAFAKMGEGVLKSLDEVFTAYNGRNLIQNLLGVDAKGDKVGTSVKDAIDGISESIQGWVKANPDKITDFLDSLRNIDWKGLGKGFAKGLGDMAKAVQTFADVFGGKNMERLGRAMAYLMPLGSFLTILGGVLKGGRHGIAGLVTFGVGIGRFLAGVGGAIGAGALANFGYKIQKLIEDLKNFGKLKAATEVAETAAKTASKKSVKIGNYFKTMLKGLGGIAMVAAVPVIIGGSVMLTIKAVKQIVKDLGTISKDMNKLNPSNLKKMAEIGSYIGGAMTIIGGVVGGLVAGGLLAPEAVAAVVGGIAGLGILVDALSAMARIFTGNVAASIKSLVDASNNMGKIADNLSMLKKKKFEMGGLKKAVGALIDMGGILKNKDLPTESEASAYKTLYTNLKDAIEAIRKSADELKKISEVKFDVEKARDKAEKIGEGMVDVYNAIKAGIEEGGGKVGWREASRSKKADDIVSNIQSMLSSITGSFDDLNAILDSNLQFGRGRGGRDGIVAKAKKIAEGIWSTYDEIYHAIAGDDITTEYKTGGKGQATQTRKATTRPDITPAMQNEVKNLGEFMGQMTGVFTQLRSAYDSITGDNSLSDVDTTAFDESSIIAGDIIKSIGNMWTKIQPGLASLGEVGGEDISAQFEGLLSMIQGIKPVITEIASLTQELGGMGGEEGGLPGLDGGFGQIGKDAKGKLQLEGILGMLPGMVKALGQVAEEIGGIDFETTMPNLDSLGTMIDKIGEYGTEIQTLAPKLAEVDISGISSFATKIRTMLSQINSALNIGAIQQIQASINAFRAAMNSMIAALNADFSNVKVTVNIDGELTGDEELLDELADARAAIAAAKRAIAALSGNIGLSISVSLSLSGVDSAVQRMYSAAARLRAARASLRAAGGAATGGLITPEGVTYRSKGGGVPHRTFPGHPKGTDTVPTWLTPGEYVTKKKAVNFWGVDFMRKINHMDVSGVMRAMSAKAGNIVNGARTTIINNNTTNNYNMNNNQTIHTNNPHFAFRRSRALGAL